MEYIKGTITNIAVKNSAKTNDYISVQFTPQGENQRKYYKHFYLNHSDKNIAKKAVQMLYKMKSKKTDKPETADISIILNAECFFTVTDNEYKNVSNIYFIA